MPRLFLALGLTLALAAPGLAAPIPISGWVADAHGKPLAGARVILSPLPSVFAGERLAVTGGMGGTGGVTPEPTAKATTDSTGGFTLEAPDVGMWRVRIEAAGLVPVELDLTPLVEARDLPPLPTAIVADTGIEIRVVDAQGKPVPGARVTAESTSPGLATAEEIPDFWRSAPRSGATGPDGVLRLPRVARERLKLRASVPGFAPAEVASGDAKVVLRLAPALPRTVLVRGADGQPVAGALVAAGPDLPASALTDEGGRATILATAKKLQPIAWTADGRRASSVARPAAPPGEPDLTAPLSLRLSKPPERLSGQVTDRLDRQPLAGTVVWPRWNPAAWVRTDARGGYSLAMAPGVSGGSAVPDSAKALSAVASGYLPSSLLVPPPGRGERALRAPTFALEPAAVAEGVVVDAAGQPVAGADVSAAVPASLFDWRSPRALARSGPEGRFLLRGLAPAKPYEIQAHHRGFAITRLPLAEQKPRAVRSGIRLVLRRGRTVKGRVVDGAGQPVATATVQVTSGDPEREGAATVEQTAVDAAGRFAVDGLLPGKIDLTARAPGFALTRKRQIQIPVGEGSFELGPIPLGTGVSLAGIAVDREGHPVAGATVVAQAEGAPFDRRNERRESGEASTGGDGRFAVPSLSRGSTFVVTIEREGFATKTLTGIRTPLAEPLKIVLSPAARLAGEVVDEGGAPVSGALVRTRNDARLNLLLASIPPGPSPRATTDDAGHFELRDVPLGKLTVSAGATGFLSASQAVEVAAGENRNDLRLVLPPGATVAGRVVAPDGAPAVGAEVSVAVPGRFTSSQGLGVSTDGDGAYFLSSVPPGPRTLTATLAGATPAVRDLTVRVGENRLDFQLAAGLEIAGRVVDPAGAPVGGAEVTLSADDPLPHATLSGDDGAFRFAGLRGGAYHLAARQKGFAGASQEVRLAETSVRDVELRLTGGGAIAGRILGLSPEQLAEVKISALLTLATGSQAFSADGRQSTEPDARGEYRLPDLPSGDWQVMAFLGRPGRTAQGKAQLPPGVPEVRLDLEFPTGFSLSGHLLRAGQPLPGAIVSVHSADVETHGMGSSDTQGAFRLDGLKPGTYDLTVRTLTAGQLHQESLEITADREIEIDLPALDVRGRVVDADDLSPLAEASLSLELAQPNPSIQSAFPGHTQTGSDGTFILEAGAEGDYRVVAHKDGYAPVTVPIHLAAGGGTDDVKVAMTPSAGLRFTVRDATGNPPSQVSAALLDPAGPMLLASNYPVGEGGRVRISEAPTGHWLLLVTGESTATATVAVDVPGPGPAVTLPDRTRLTILVPELAGKPAGVKLQLTGADGFPYRSLRFGFLLDLQIGNGRLELDDVPPGAWQLRVELPGGKVRQGSAVTTPGAPAQVVLQ